MAQPDRAHRWARRVLRLYPRAWRERYLAEMLHVIEQQPVTLWTLGDFLLGGVDARLHPHLLPRRLIAMQQQLRTSAIALFLGIVLFGLAWVGVLQVRDPLPAWIAVTQRYPATLYTFDVAQSMGPLAILAYCVGGVRIVWSALGDALAQRRRGVLLAILAVGVAIVGIVLFAIFALNASTVRVAPSRAIQIRR